MTRLRPSTRRDATRAENTRKRQAVTLFACLGSFACGRQPDSGQAVSVSTSLPSPIVALCRPETYPHRPPSVRLLQTHISCVLIAGAHAYKIKKPVRLSFLDFSTLNRRLAPDVYLGAVSICPDGAGFRFGDANDSDAVEYAVLMRYLDNAQRLEDLPSAAALLRVIRDRRSGGSCGNEPAVGSSVSICRAASQALRIVARGPTSLQPTPRLAMLSLSATFSGFADTHI